MARRREPQEQSDRILIVLDEAGVKDVALARSERHVFVITEHWAKTYDPSHYRLVIWDIEGHKVTYDSAVDRQ